MEKGCFVQHSEDILHKNGCADMNVDINVNGKSLRILESARVCLCKGDFCNKNDEKGNTTSMLLSMNNTQNHYPQKPGTDISPNVIPGQSK